ncbi:Hemolysin activation/secretion protein [Verrucomicrobium sp. GAS474]|uniref:ShlB/FhaC/HecB family hemolysin secretion/activation protein n=1 Tax=Verrucomicrobium sp. GAS474 TaxID=1882831 RepID=UPI00087CDA77|nr:ShlB/FhaC/HecB family hemolysin secretion/activation protein [Verrucomicrobium sp. GAS474]SDU15671.1 Hemolysin activation/secretion protein [Verrucomicrobium sp. GAS474]
MTLILKKSPKGAQTGLWILALAFLGGLSPLRAQDYSSIQPKLPPMATLPAFMMEKPLPEENDNTKLLVEKLQAVVFVDAAGKVAAQPEARGGVVTNGIPLLQRDDFDAVVAPYLGKRLSLASLSALVRDVVVWCRAQDRPVVDVVVPQQDITNGVLQLVFIEGRVGKVEAEGTRWFSKDLLVSGVRLRPGEPISTNRLASDVNWVNQNPFHQSTAVFSPGSDVGTTDITLRTEDRFPFRFYTGYENTGNAITGEDRYEAGFNWGNAFLQNQLLSYQYTMSGDGTAFVGHSGSWVIPLPWHHTLTFFGALSTSHAVSGPLDIRGAGDQVGARYEIPLPEVAGVYRHSVTLGYDWKQSQNSLEFSSIPASNSTVDVGQEVLSYSGTITDPLGTTTVNPQLYWSGNSVWGHQNHEAYNAVRSGASPDYTYLRLALSRQTNLPWNFSLAHDLQWQVSDGPLLPSEQLQFGGAQSIRGYSEYDLSGTDEGWTLRNELRLPPVSLTDLLGANVVPKQARDQLQILGFFDIGEARSHRDTLTDNAGRAKNAIPMASVGPGIRYNLGNYLSFHADYGIQLRDTGDPHSSRWSLGMTLAY